MMHSTSSPLDPSQPFALRVHNFQIQYDSELGIQEVPDGEHCKYTFRQCVFKPLQHISCSLGPLHDRIVQCPLLPLLVGIFGTLSPHPDLLAHARAGPRPLSLSMRHDAWHALCVFLARIISGNAGCWDSRRGYKRCIDLLSLSALSTFHGI